MHIAGASWPQLSNSEQRLVSISRRVICNIDQISVNSGVNAGNPTLRTDHQTSPLLCTTIDSLNDINQLLLILQYPVELIVVSRPEIAHHVLVAEEEHERHWIVQFIHLLEVRDLVKIANVDYCEILDTIGNTYAGSQCPTTDRLKGF